MIATPNYRDGITGEEGNSSPVNDSTGFEGIAVEAKNMTNSKYGRSCMSGGLKPGGRGGTAPTVS